MKTHFLPVVLCLCASVLALSGCYAPPAPPPPRVHVQYEPPVYQPPRVAVLYVESERGLSGDQLQGRREEALSYLRRQGYLRDQDVLVEDTGNADRIIRIRRSAEIGADFDVRVFTPNESSGATSSIVDDRDDWDEPRRSVTIIRQRGYYRDPFWDPWFYSSYPRYGGFHGFYERDYLHPFYPRYYSPRVHRYPPRYWHAPRHSGTQSSPGYAPPPATSAPEGNTAPPPQPREERRDDPPEIRPRPQPPR